MSKIITRLSALALLVMACAFAQSASAAAPKPATGLGANVTEDNLLTLVADLPTQDVNGNPLSTLTKIELYLNEAPYRTFENVSTAVPFKFSMQIDYIPLGYNFAIELYNGDDYSDMQYFDNVNAHIYAPVEATNLVASVKGTTVTLSCDLPKVDTNGNPIPVVSRIMLFRDTEVVPFRTFSDVSTAQTFKYTDNNVPVRTSPYKYCIMIYNGNEHTPLQYFPSVIVNGNNGPASRPAATNDLKAEVIHNNVLITFTMPTEDENGNDLDWSKTAVRITRNDLKYPICYEYANISDIVNGVFEFVDENVPNGIYTYTVDLSNDYGTTIVYAGDKPNLTVNVNSETIEYPAVTDLAGAYADGKITLTWSNPEMNEELGLQLAGFYVFYNSVKYASVPTSVNGKYTYTLDELVEGQIELYVVAVYEDSGIFTESAPSNKYVYTPSDSLTSIQADGNVEYYNMQGIRVANPTRGLYITTQGKKIVK